MAFVEDRTIIEQFFTALLTNDVKTCENLSHKLTELSEQFSEYAPWVEYFQGVLMEERDNNWAAAEVIYRALLSDPDLEPFLRGQVLLSTSNAYMRQGLWQEILDSCNEASALFLALDEPIEQAKTWIRIAQAHTYGFQYGAFDSASLTKAVTFSDKAIVTLEGNNAFENLISQTNYFMACLTSGMIKIELNEWHDAIQDLQKSLDIAQKLDNRYWALFSYANLADALANVDDTQLDSALDASRAALEIAQEFNDRHHEFLVHCQMGFFHKVGALFDEAINHFDRGFAHVDDVRASLPDAQTKANFMATVTEEYANAVLTCIEAEDRERAFNYMEQARGRVFLELLGVDSNDNSESGQVSVFDLQAIQEVLPPDYMLLSYYTTGVIESSTARLAQNRDVHRVRFPDAKIFIFAVTRDDIQLFDADLNPNQIIPSTLNEAVETYFLRDGMRRFLHSFLVRPIQHLLEGKRRIAICPHGPLHFIPFHALIDGLDRPLLTADGPEIVYAPSATVLVRNLIRTESSEQDELAEQRDLTDGCLTVGFDGIINEATGETVAGLDPLAHAETEAYTIARMTGGKALIGLTQKKTEFLSLASKFLYLHFSCHGAFQPDAPMQSALYIGPDEVLTASEVVEMSRLNCRLVTLSACESGLNQVKRGDELYGFARAFFQAGAKAIVATQWRVDERTTRVFAEIFVVRLRNGEDVATALKSGQLALRAITKAELKTYIERFDDETSHGHFKGKNDQTNRAATELNGNLMPSLDALLKNAGDDDEVLAEYPFFWAPYILIGDPDL